VAAKRTGTPVGQRPAVMAACVIGISAALLVLGALIGAPYAQDAAYLLRPAPPWWLLTLAFAATEACVLHVQVRRETRSISLSEIPLVLGLFLSAPLTLLVGRLLGTTVALVAVRRQPALKVLFNLALAGTETALAVAVFTALAPAPPGPGPAAWLAAYAAAFAGSTLDVLMVGLVIALHDGTRPPRTLLRETFVQPVPLLAGTVALVGVVSLAASATTAWLLAGFGGLLLLAFRAYATLSDRHLHLDRLYRFSQSLGRETEIGQVLATVLGEAREVLHAERASAAFVTADGDIVARVRLGPGAETSRSEDPATDADAWVLTSVVDGGPLVMPRSTRDAQARRWLEQYGMRDALAVPLAGAAGITGVLVVADRLGDVRTFGPDDAVLLETVANHAALALRNGELIGQLRHDAAHDSLTGLPNRRSFQTALMGALQQVTDGEAPGAAVLIADLDDFQEVNDALGHPQGDRLLVEIGNRLSAELGGDGDIARLNGDEFAVLVPATADEERVLAIARRLLRALERPIPLDGQEVGVSASVGIALAPRHAADPAVLLKRAERAMHEAKASSRQIRVYEAGLGQDSPRRLTLATDLRDALHKRAIEVHVQPQARPDTGAVTGVEALVRWQHPELGPISPDELIPIAERNGLIAELTRQVLDSALAACARWRAGGADLGIAVNLSARSLLDADLVDSIARALRRHAVPPARLTLEVTEGSVMTDPTRAIAVLHQVRALGVRLSVDDFGTGQSSLAYLQQLPVHEVKIDKSFVLGLAGRPQDRAIVRAIVDLGRHLGLEVVAEGVEDAGTQDMLSAMGCDLIQGYHLGRPMPTEELLPWLAARAAPEHPLLVRVT